MSDALDIVRRNIEAYQRQDREAADSLLDEHVRFTSPQDDHIDKARFLEVCFPTADRFVHQVVQEFFEPSPGVVFVRYVTELQTGEVFSNVERILVRDGRIVDIKVYFGGPDAFADEPPGSDIPELEDDQTVAPRPEEAIADVARQTPDLR